MATYPLASITPSKSGDVARAYYLKNEVTISKTIGTVLTERVFDLFSLIILSIIGSIFYPNIKILIIIISGLILISILVIVQLTKAEIPLINDIWNKKFQNMMLSIRSLMSNKNAFIIVSLYSLTIWLLVVFQTISIFYSLNINIPFFFTMANIPIAIFIGMIPVTLGGMGTRDAAIILLFSGYSKPSELLGAAILFSMVRYWFVSILGVPFMLKFMKKYQ